MRTDPRLASVELLTLAAMRVQRKREEACTQPPDWRACEGISSLLAAARHLPKREPWEDMPTVDTTSGLGKLLAEARQWQKGGAHGA
jgi:hypothetical protein